MTWSERVERALARLAPPERDWLDSLPARERALVLALLVELDASPE